MKLFNRIEHLHPCHHGSIWLAKQTDAQEAWDKCPNGLWMLWLLGETTTSEPWTAPRKKLFLCLLECAGRPLNMFEYWQTNADKDKIKKTTLEQIKAIKRWALGEGSLSAAMDAFNTIRNQCYPSGDLTATIGAAGDYDLVLFGVRRGRRQIANIVRKHFPRPPRIPRAKKCA